MPIPAITGLLDQLTKQRDDQRQRLAGELRVAAASGRAALLPSERRSIDDLAELDRRIRDLTEENARAGTFSSVGSREGQAMATRAFAQQAVHDIRGEGRALTSGAFDIPSLVLPQVVGMTRPGRLLDLLVNRQEAPTTAIEYFRQTVRTTNAATVADNAQKPTSVYTVVPKTDRCRVIAHLSEPAPIRLWDDVPAITQFLTSEMNEGLLDAVEHQIIAGGGTGEDFTGLLSTAGTTAVAWDTDLTTTLRSAVTASQVAGDVCDAWVVNPVDAARFDTERAPVADGGWLNDGYANGPAGSGNVLGSVGTRVVSNSVPAGTAILADWSQLKLFIREGTRLDMDVAGTLFQHNQFQLRCEMRAVSAVLRPSSFYIVDLTA